MADEFGFKRVNPGNWLTLDPAWHSTVMSARDGDPVASWIAELLEIGLSESVPVELRKLFEVARAALAYSPVYYPFLALGTEQTARMAERAVLLKCNALNAPGKLKNFADRIDWLSGALGFDEETKRLWHVMRRYRNIGTHPDDQMILNPALALSTVGLALDLVNELFR